MKFISLLLLFVSLATFGQSGVWTRTGIVDSTISITGSGNSIWAATQNNGVQHLEINTGNLTIYNQVNTGFITNDFRSIAVSPTTVYAGTFDNGYYTYFNSEWTHYDTLNSPLPGMQVNDFCLYNDSIIFIATDQGLVKIENATWTIFDSTIIAAKKLTCLYKDNSNRLWIGSKYHGVTKLEDGIFTNYNYENAGINNDWIRAISSNSVGLMFIADYLGVNTYQPETDDWLFVYNTFTAPMSSERVNKIGFQQNGTLWFATHIGVTSADTSNFWNQYYDYNSNLPHNVTDGLYIDDADRVWVATYGGVAVFTNTNELPATTTQLFLSPNPCNNLLSVSANPSSEITIYNLQGASVTKDVKIAENFGEQILTADVTSLPTGMYWVVMTTGETSVTEAFIKK